MPSLLQTASLLAVLAVFVSAHDEDLGFDVSDDFEVEIDAGRRWNDGEIAAPVGRVFHLVVPKEAFDGEFDRFEAKRSGGTPLPSWLLFDKIGGVFWGVPLVDDVGTLRLVVRAVGDKNASEEVAVAVSGDAKTEDRCPSSEDRTVLTLLLDRGVRAIKPKQRVIAINNVAKFFGLPYSAFTLKPQLEKDDITDSSVVLAGPGNLRSRSSKSTSLLQVPVGCDGRLWVQTAPLVHQLKQQARDGTISEVLGLPLVGWRVKTETRPVLRAKRQVDDYGSGDYDDDYYDDTYDDQYDEEEDDNATTNKASSTSTSTTTVGPSPTHPHRHHHGESLNPEDVDPDISVIRDHHQSSSPRNDFETIAETSPTVSETVPPTTTTSTTTTTTTTTEKLTTEEDEVKIIFSSTTSNQTEPTSQKPYPKPDPSYDYDYEEYDLEEDNDEEPNESKTIVPEIPKHSSPETTVFNEPTTSTARSTSRDFVVDTMPSTSSTESETTLMIVEDTESPTVIYPETVTLPPTTTASPSTTPTPTTTTTTTTTAAPVIPTTTEKVLTTEEEEVSTVKLTTVRHIISSPQTTTTADSLEYETKNFRPYIENRLKQMSVIAGKIFRYAVPKNTFNDMEDGYDLTLEFLNSRGEPLSKDSWCHFNPHRREIYGLPLEEDVSKWEYVLRATDREGASANDTFTIQVQQHKSQRVVNHEISLYMRIEKPQEFPHFVDWCLRTLRALGRVYNTNMSEITVRHVNYTSEPVVFTWTNDSIPTNQCPANEIDRLFKMLTATDGGDPSQQLYMLLAPELRVKKVTKQGLGVCETPQVPVTPPTNFPPFLRNPVDHINATVGELLVFRVPDDTFYDPEDTDSRSLNISLLTADRQQIKPSSWLQFDSTNREFYGIPRKAGRSEYQLICADSAGLDATDSLEIVVYPAPKMHYNVEFSMTVETYYDTFVNSAAMQRKFVEKLQEIFGDRNASFIHVAPFKRKDDWTIVTWYNKSLSAFDCPHEEISRLEAVIKNHDRSISNRVHSIMGREFPVSTIKVLPTGPCRPRAPAPPAPPPAAPAEEPPRPDDRHYLVTFVVPAVVVAAMLLAAAAAACALYRRRRTGKLDVGEEGGRHRGVPVIFQEELEEKPESGTKAPVILEDEKPPLAPPDYGKRDDSEPYQPPPPPFARAQEKPRPRPTPTYRKPPPYVPP